MTEYQEVRTTKHESGQEQRAATFKVTQLIWLLLGILEAMLALRFIFKLIGVNPTNAFASLLYTVTGFFVAPFASLTGAPSTGRIVLEISTLIAMIVYLLIAWGLERIVYVIFYRPRGSMSVKQTTVAEHTPPQAVLGVNRTTTTEQTTTPAPMGTSQTTVTESTNTQTPGTL